VACWEWQARKFNQQLLHHRVSAQLFEAIIRL